MPVGPVRLYKEADSKLKGLPDHLLTVLLVLMAIALVAIALKGSPILKGATLAWVVLP